MQRLKKQSRRAILTAAAVATLWGTTARAADLFWDANGSDPGTGGTGNWLTPSNVNNWRTGGTGGALGTWSDGNNAIFPSAAGAVTVDGAVSATGLRFDVSAYTVTGGNTITLTGTPFITLNSPSGSAAFNATLSNPLSSSVQVLINKGLSTGIHTLFLGGSNTFTGGLRLEGDKYRINMANGNALGGGTGGTVTVAGNTSSITTDSGGSGPTGFYTISNAFVLNPLSTANFLTGFSATKVGMTLDFTGQISGAADVVVDSNPFNTGTDGQGLTIFSNSNNTYTGSTIINCTADGAVRIGASGSLPSTTNLVFGRGTAANNVGIFDVNGNNITIASLSTNLNGSTAGGITNSNGGAGGTIGITGSAIATYTSVIGNVTNTSQTSGSDNLALHLTSTHTGTLTLTGVSTYAGATTIDRGTLVLGHTSDASNTIVSNTTVNANGVLASAAGTQATTGRTGGSVTVNSAGIVAPGTAGGIGTLVAASLSANSGSVFNFDLANTSNYDVFSLGAGALTLDSGTHTINVAGAAAAGSYTLMSYGSRIWDLTNAFTLGTTPGGGFSYGLTQSDTGVILNIAALTPSLVWDIGGGGSPIVDGAGTWANGSTDFTDTSSNTGATFLNANNYDVTFGSSALNSGGAMTLGGNVRVGGKLTFGPINSASPYQIGLAASSETLTTSSNGILTQSSGSIEAPVVMEASQTWTTDPGTTLTVNSVISESGGARTLTKAGTGTVLLSNANTFTGGLNVTGGTVSVTNAAAAGSGTIALSNNAIFRTATSLTVANAISVDATGGAITVDSSQTSTFTGNITGAGALAKTGAGTAVLTGTNAFNGLTISGGGAVAAGADSALGSGNLTLSGGILRATANFATAKNVNLSSSTGRFDTNGFDLTVSGTITGSGALAKEGAGTLVLSGNNSNTGQIQFPATTGGGTIETLSTNALGGSGAANFLILANGTLRTTNDLTTSAIRGTNVLTKEGAGKLTVTGTSNASNLNAGASIVVNAGSVQMDSLTGLGGNNSASANQMPITLNSGTELLLNWSNASESRFSKNITLNSGTITRMNNAAGNDITEFTAYSGSTDLGGVLTASGSSTIRNQQIATATDNKQLQIQMPVVVATGGTLTLSSANNAGDYHSHRTVLRGANPNNFPNDAVTLQAGATIVMSGAGEKAIGNPNTQGKPIVGQGTTGNEATLKLDTHTYLNDIKTGSSNITRLIVAGSGDGGLRIEAPMNAAYTTPNGGGAPVLRTYDGTTGLFGLNTTSTQEGGTVPSGYSQIGNAYTVMSPKRFNQLSNSFGSPAVTLGGTLTLAATDAAGATGTIDNGPDAASSIKLALDNAATSGNLVYKILPSANGSKVANFAGLLVKRTNTGAGTVTAKIDPDSFFTGVLRMQSVDVIDARLDLTDNKLVTQSNEGSWNGSAYTGIEGLVQSGRGDGSWNGNGIVTSMTDATTSVLTGLAVGTGAEIRGLGPTDTDIWAGQTINGDSTLVMYTWGGDADLNGELNGDDYFQIDSHVLQSGSVFGFHNGDFDYNGEINGDDYFILDSNILQAQGSGIVWPTGAGTSSLSAVPEPAVMGLLAFGGISATRRRRPACRRSMRLL